MACHVGILIRLPTAFSRLVRLHAEFAVERRSVLTRKNREHDPLLGSENSSVGAWSIAKIVAAKRGACSWLQERLRLEAANCRKRASYNGQPVPLWHCASCSTSRKYAITSCARAGCFRRRIPAYVAKHCTHVGSVVICRRRRRLAGSAVACMRRSSSKLSGRSSAKSTYSCAWISRTRRAGIGVVPSPTMQASALELSAVTVGATASTLTDVDRLGPNDGTVDGCIRETP